MEQVTIKSYVFIVSFLILAGGLLYSTVAKANATTTPLAGEQLAYYVGFHSSPNAYTPVYYGPQYYHHHQKKLYWSGWRSVGHGCRKNCLIDRWSGRVLRCNRVCRH